MDHDIVKQFNALSDSEARVALERYCGSSKWINGMLANRPFTNGAQVDATSESLWGMLTETDWREAFAHHPKIGDIDSLRSKFATTRTWASGEQAGTTAASEETLQALAAGNAAYEARFGYIFIVCATGKTADEMLALLNARLHNDPADELPIAAEEQKKITRLRLAKR